MAAFGADDALGAMIAATLPRSTMTKEQMQAIGRGARPKTARPRKDAKPTAPWTKDDVSKLRKACKEVPSMVEKQARWKRISGLVGRGKRECYDKYKELKELKAAKTSAKASMQATISKAGEGSTFEERLAALGLKEPPAGEAAAAPAPAPAPAPATESAPAASPSGAWGGGAAAAQPAQTRRRPRAFFGAEDLVIDDGVEEAAAPPPPGGEPPPQSGRTRCVASNDLVIDEFGDEL